MAALVPAPATLHRPALVLASASPRRRQLLEPYVALVIRPADIDESPWPDEAPRPYVARLAAAKAAAVRTAGPGPVAGERSDQARSEQAQAAVGADVVLAADTTVDVDGAIVGKPVDAADARRILAALSGRTHLVHTGVAVHGGGPEPEVFVVSTTVRFAPLTPAAIDWYVATGEPMDVAGAYAIQGRGGAFVASIEGSFSNVVGLPLVETLAALRRAGLSVAE